MLFQAHPSEVSAACVLHPVAPDCLKISIIALQNGVIKIVAGAQKGACSMQGAALSALRKSSFRYCHYVHLAGEQTAREAEWLLRVQSQAGAGSDQSLSQARGEVPAGSPQPPALPRASCHVFCKFSILLEGPVFHPHTEFDSVGARNIPERLRLTKAVLVCAGVGGELW